MVYVLAFLQLFMITSIAVYECKLKSPVVFLWATLLLMFGITHFFTTFFDRSFSLTIFFKASIFSVLFCIFYLSTRLFLNLKYENNLNQKLSNISYLEDDKKYYLLKFSFFISVFYLFYFIKKSSNSFLDITWSDVINIGASQKYVSLFQAFMLSYFSLCGLLLYYFVKRDKRSIVYFFVILFIGFLFRKRISFIPIFVAFIAIYLFNMKKIRISTIIVYILFAFFVIYIVYAIRAFRWYGSYNSYLKEGSIHAINDQIILFLKSDNGELGLKKWFYYFIKNNNNFVNFGKGHTYIRMLLVYFPTEFTWNIKPPDFAISMGQAIGMTAARGSMHPTLFADCYANLGWFGIFLGILWAFLANISDRILLKQNSKIFICLMYALFSYSFIVIGRGSVYNGFHQSAIGLPILLFFEWFSRKIKLNRKKIY
ncbi:MAG: oligosaccharide repeat unit polymerase [Lactobacillales bacterium]|nr:oligosaccharide repeat unit polymerase [Lactobacillales bacterium]